MATSGATLYSIYNRLSSAPEYHPFSADTFSDWSMEAGDIIRVSRDGKHYDSPVHTSQMTWRGQSQISVSSDGNEKRESIAKATKRKYGRNGSGYRNDNHLWQELLDDYNGLYSFFEVTSSRMFVTFSGMYDGLSSDFEVTRSRMAADFHGMYDGLSSEFEVTRSRMRVEFRGMYDGLSSDFEVTRSRMAADFQGKYDGLASSFDVTRSRMAADFQGKYDGLSSEFEVTRSQFHVDLVNSYNQLSSGIEAAANYSMLYTNGKTSRAYIMTQINSNTEQTEALINADQILIGTSGNAKVNLANVISLGDSSTVLIKKDVTVNETYGANGVKLKTDGTIRGHKLTLIKTGGQEGEYGAESITLDDIDEMVVKVQLDGNTIRLWKRGADLAATSGDGIINFSKATTLDDGTWGGTNNTFPLTLKAQQTNDGTTTDVAQKTFGFGGSYGAHDFEFELVAGDGGVAVSSTPSSLDIPLKINLLTGAQSAPAQKYSKTMTVGAVSAINALQAQVTVDRVSLASNYWKLGDTASDTRTNIYIEGHASNGNTKSNELFYLSEGTFNNGKHCVTLNGKGQSAQGSGVYEDNVVIGRISTETTYNNAKKLGWNNCRTAMVIPTEAIGNVIDSTYTSITVKKPNADEASTFTDYVFSLNINDSFQPTGSTSKIRAIELKYGNNVIARKTDNVPYKATGWTVSNLVLATDPQGFTKATTPSGHVYYTKNDTSGEDKILKFYVGPKVTVDGNEFNSDYAYKSLFEGLPTGIWSTAYSEGHSAGVIDGRVGYTANSSLQAPYGTAIGENIEDAEVTITANSKDSTLELATGTYRPSGTTTDRKCVIAKIGSTTVARIGFDWKYTQTEYDNAEANFKNKIHHLTPDSARNHVDIDIKGNKRWGSGSSVAGCSIGPNGKQYWNVKIYDSSGNELHYEQTDRITSGFIIDQKNVTVTANGTYRIADAVAFVVVDVPTGGGGSSYPNSIKMNLYNSVQDGKDWIYYWYSTNKSAGVTQGHSKIFHY